MKIYESGEEFLTIEFSEEMRLSSNLIATATARSIMNQDVEGIIEAYPSNATLMLRFDPESLDRDVLIEKVEAQIEKETARPQHVTQTRMIELPIWFDDPLTNEAIMRFRPNHQDPSVDDLTYCARINGFDTNEAFIEQYYSAPWLVSNVGFVAGVYESYQLVPRERQIQAPKYLRPRTDTPVRALGHGGCFSAFYAVRGGGGYQILGRSAVPVYDSTQLLPDFVQSSILFKGGDMVRYRPVDETEYDRIRVEVEANTYRYKITELEFNLEAFEADNDGYVQHLVGKADHA